MIRRVLYTRRLQNQHYKETGAILRQVLIADGKGGRRPSNPAEPWPVQYDNVRFRVDPTGAIPHEDAPLGAVMAEGDYDVAFPAGTDVTAKDRVKAYTLGNRVFEMVGPRWASNEVSRIMVAIEVV